MKVKEEQVEEKEMYVVPKNEVFEDDDMDAEDSYDLGDDMSEEDARGKKYKRDNSHKLKGQVPTKEPAKCWQHFEKVKVPSKTEQGVEVSKARCKHCFDLYAYVQGSSTSTLNRHYKKKCKVLNKKLGRAKIQSRLRYKPSNGTRIPTIVPPIGSDHATIKELIAKMIVVHGYSFAMVEHEWFNTIMKYLNPRYQFIGRKEIGDECMRVFKKEKEVLKLALENVEYISLTADLWTSNQTISYMRVVAHYIDEHWKMQTRVLAFMELDPSHAGHLIADAIFDCVTEWKIENKVVSITLENAAKDDLVRHLKAKFAVRRGMNFEAKYFHVRCCAHVINLMVQDVTTCMAPLINNLRETMKYLKKSPSRLQKFVDNCKILGVEIGEHLNLDVCTRWSSTYKMLKTGLPYRQALASYAVSDAKYKWEPTSKEWDLFEVIEPLLYSLALLTTAFSAQGYLTTNIFYLHITCIKIALSEAMVHKDKTYKAMGIAMMDTLNMYWEEMNNVMVLATILDPRYKMMYVEWFFTPIYDEETAEIELADVRKEFETLYEKYDAQKRQAKQKAGESSSKSSCMTNSSMTPTHCEFQAFLLATSSRPSKSELINYIEDQTEKMIPEFNLLEWWKVNAPRYPVLANMARRFLTIPASSMSLESTFTTGGRVLDDFRSSLKPAMVEALMCVASYIKGAHKDLNVVDGEEDEEEDVQTIKLPKTLLDCNY